VGEGLGVRWEVTRPGRNGGRVSEGGFLVRNSWAGPEGRELRLQVWRNGHRLVLSKSPDVPLILLLLSSPTLGKEYKKASCETSAESRAGQDLATKRGKTAGRLRKKKHGSSAINEATSDLSGKAGLISARLKRGGGR